MKLSELKPEEVTLVQRSAESDQPLKLSEMNPDEVQIVQQAPGAARSFGDHFANSFMLGYMPQAEGALSQVLPNPSADVDAKLKAQGFNITQPKDDYLSNRDAAIARLNQESTANPYASGAGTVGGAIAGGMALAPLAPISGATKAARAIQAAKIGATYGLASNPGDTEGQYGGLQAGDRAWNGVLGAVTGGTLQPAIETGAQGLQWAKGQLSDYAAEKAAKALGMTKADYKRLGPDQAKALGRAALDQNIVTPFSTPATIAEKTEAMKDVAGQKVGQVIDQSQSQLDQMAPVGMMPDGSPVQATPVRPKIVPAGKTVQATPIEYAPKLDNSWANTQTVYPDTSMDLSGSGLSRSNGNIRRTDGIEIPVSPVKQGAIPAAESGDFQTPIKATMQKAGASGDFFQPIVPRPAGSIDAQALASELRSKGDASQLAKVPGMEGVASKINTFLDTLAKNPQDMSLRDAQELRGQIDGAINWGKKVPDMAGTQQYLVDIRNAISDAMNNSVDLAASKNGGNFGALKAANKQYSTVAKINEIAANRAAMNSANRAVGLTDTIAGGAGAGVGATVGGAVAGPVGAEVGAGAGSVVGGGINKFGRTYGPSLQATGANRAAQLSGFASNASKLVAQNPGVAQMVLQNDLRQNNSAPDDVIPNAPLAQSQQPNRSPARGPDAWAQQGVQKLGLQDQGFVNRLLQDPKAKQLLIQASDLTPGSKAMKNIQSQLQGYRRTK